MDSLRRAKDEADAQVLSLKHAVRRLEVELDGHRAKAGKATKQKAAADQRRSQRVESVIRTWPDASSLFVDLFSVFLWLSLASLPIP